MFDPHLNTCASAIQLLVGICSTHPGDACDNVTNIQPLISEVTTTDYASRSVPRTCLIAEFAKETNTSSQLGIKFGSVFVFELRMHFVHCFKFLFLAYFAYECWGTEFPYKLLSCFLAEIFRISKKHVVVF